MPIRGSRLDKTIQEDYKYGVKKSIPILILIILIIGGFFYFFQKSQRKSSEIRLENQYLNPFEKESQYLNPFDEYKNPFDVIRAIEEK